jgi:hypothetical protein
MTSTNALIAELEAQGLRPLVRDGRLKLAGPKARVTPDLVERVRAHKRELMDLLAPDAGGDATGVDRRDEQRDGLPLAEPQPRVEEVAAPIVGWRDDPQLNEQVRFEIERWWPQMRLMNWSEERIWRRTFWPHIAEHPRGLASVLEPGDQIRFVDCAIGSTSTSATATTRNSRRRVEGK